MKSIKFCIFNFALCIAAAVGGAARADHERHVRAPWSPQFEMERLAAMEVSDGMVVIPAGWFVMGSDPSVDRDAGPQEQPQRWVYLDTFAIDRYEISNIHYLRYVLGAGAPAPPYWVDGVLSDKLALHPVIGVTWREADAYCRWAGKRLPMEAEWEKAARGTDGRLFPWGNQPAGWGRSNIAHPGSKRGFKYPPLANIDRYDRGRSIYGVYQMAGNVGEWVADWFDPEYYANATAYNPEGPAVGQERVFRGGSWNEDPEVARSAGRGARAPEHRSYLIGFRCAADSPSPAGSTHQSVLLKADR